MNETFIPACDYSKKKWYVIDCKGKQLGRLSSSIIPLLTGKSKAYYHPAFDTGDYVILLNVDSITVDTKIERMRVFNPGRPGSSLKKITNELPKQIIEKCIQGMMPNGFAKKQLSKRLKIYQGSEHPHNAQNPIILNNL
jgi:large subunit ribosomal protein L13